MYNGSVKVLLIQPSMYFQVGELLKFKQAYIPSITMPTLAALTPEDIEVKIIDEHVDEINFEEKADLVGITCHTFSASRAYEIADEFRKRAVPVIIGGIHPTVLPEEAKEHCDSVVIGEAEGIWTQILTDRKNKCMKSFYRASAPDMKHFLAPKIGLINLKKYKNMPFSKLPTIPLETSRGCPYDCDFCLVTKFYGKCQRNKPVENVIREINGIGAKYYFFCDVNIGANFKRAKELFKALIPLKIKWAGQFNIRAAKDPEMLLFAGKSGCYAAYLGIESISKESLKSVGKHINKVEEYEALIGTFHGCGIPVHASFVFGLDGDDESSIERTSEFVDKNNIDKTTYYFLFPLPGTAQYERIKKEGRMVNDRYWLDKTRPMMDIHFQPKNISRQKLLKKFWEANDTTFSWRSIMKRLFIPPQPQCVTSFVSNIFYRKMIKDRQLTFS